MSRKCIKKYLNFSILVKKNEIQNIYNTEREKGGQFEPKVVGDN